MTIASEITRIQGAKADIKTAIEAKGVSIPSSDTIDCYACCIDSIQAGGNEGYVDILLIGGGGGGGGASYPGGGGGAGGVIRKDHVKVSEFNTPIDIGIGGYYCYCSSTNNCEIRGGETSFGDMVAYGGGNGSYRNANDLRYFCHRKGASSGGTTYNSCTTEANQIFEKNGIPIYQGNTGYIATCCTCGGGGGGAGKGCTTSYRGDPGICSDISGSCQWYAGGGWGGGTSCTVDRCGGGGAPGGGDATACGAGGGGGSSGRCCGGHGGGGLAIIRYKTDGSCGICNAIGGCKYTCGDYTIHCYTTSSSFKICDFLKEKTVDYLLVGGGGGSSSYGGGGGGAVCLGNISAKNGLCVIVGAGGDKCQNGGDSCIIGDTTIKAGGGKGSICYGIGGDSGNGCQGGVCNATSSSTSGGGGGGASGDGLPAIGLYYGIGGNGKRGYGGGGSGYCSYSTIDGGGRHNCNATNYGGGAGGGNKCGFQGIAKICYPSDGSYGFSNATGGTVTTVTEDGVDYCVHTFTSDGTFCITE